MYNGNKNFKLKMIHSKNAKIDDTKATAKEKHTKILGFKINVHGKFDIMINTLYARAMNQLMKIIKISKFSKCNLNSLAIWRIGQPMIQGLVEFGFQYYTSATKEQINKIFTIPYKLARYALGIKASTPKKFIEMELDFDAIETRLKIQICNTIEQCKRAPNNTIKYETINKWNNFMKYRNITLDNNKYHNNSIFSRAISIYNEEFNSNIIDFKLNDIKENKLSLPAYTIPYPNNLLTFPKENNNIAMNNNNNFTWYTDGSVVQFYGGYAFVTFNDRMNGYMKEFCGWFNHFTNIDYF
jgi:hypothetical protein